MRSIRSTNQSVLEAVGLAGPALVDQSSAANTSPSGAFVTRKHLDTAQNTHFSGRSQFGSMSDHHLTPLRPGYPQRREARPPDLFAAIYPAATMRLRHPRTRTTQPCRRRPFLVIRVITMRIRPSWGRRRRWGMMNSRRITKMIPITVRDTMY